MNGAALDGPPVTAHPLQPVVWHARSVGVLRITGGERVALLHRLATQDLRPLQRSGHVAETLFTTAQGKVVAWVQIYSLDDGLRLVCEPGDTAAVARWIDAYIVMEDVCVEVDGGRLDDPAIAALNPGDMDAFPAVAPEATPGWCFVSALGPGAAARLGVAPPPSPGTFATADGSRFLVTGLRPALGPGVAILTRMAHWPPGARQLGVPPMTEAAWQVRRLVAGVPDAAHELAAPTNPFEVRLARIAVAWNKGCYVGQEVISRLDSYDKVARLLMGFSSEVPLPSAGALEGRLTRDGRPIGRITSWQPHAGGAVGLALVRRQAAASGPATWEGSGLAIALNLCDRPFWANVAPNEPTAGPSI